VRASHAEKVHFRANRASRQGAALRQPLVVWDASGTELALYERASAHGFAGERAHHPTSEGPMSKQTIIVNSLLLACSLTVAGAALARKPPALVEAQQKAQATLASCPHSQARDTSGYRDMLARIRIPSAATIAVAAAAPTRKMGDHLVLVCARGEIHQGSGYRDFPARLRSEPTGRQIAGTPCLVGRR
jgi:hypothetical protein